MPFYAPIRRCLLSPCSQAFVLALLAIPDTALLPGAAIPLLAALFAVPIRPVFLSVLAPASRFRPV